MVNKKQTCLVLQNGQEGIVDVAPTLNLLGITSNIRILDSEYKSIDSRDDYFTHFNMEKGLHLIGKIYALPRILRSGFINKDREVPPLLSFEDIYLAECIEAKDFVDYKDLPSDVFRYSMKHIKDVKSLKQAIINRYRISRPLLSQDEILSKGVGVTYLKIIKKFQRVDF